MPERRALRRVLPVGLTALLVAGGSVAAYAQIGGSAGALRTATVSRGDVTSALRLTGSVQPVSQVGAGFPVAGTVSSVDVAVGQTVTAGQPIASLDPAPLALAVHRAQAGLTAAQAQLAADQQGAATTSVPTTSTGRAASATASAATPEPTAAAPAAASLRASSTLAGGASPVAAGSGRAPAGSAATATGAATPTAAASGGAERGAAGSVPATTLEQQATAASEALARAQALVQPALQAALASCLPVSLPAPLSPSPAPALTLGSPSLTPGPSLSAPPPPSPTPTPAPGPTGTRLPSPVPTGSGPVTLCHDALLAAQQVQAQAVHAQAALDQAVQNMARALRAATAPGRALAPSAGAAVAGSTARSSAGTTGSGKTATAGGPGNSGGSQARTGSASAATPGRPSTTASRVAADNLALLQAQDALQSAQADLTGAVLAAPVAGVVAQLPFSAGTAASTADRLVVVGTGAIQVVVQVPLAALPQVQPGQAAQVSGEGGGAMSAGSVHTVGLLPAVGTSPPTYPVTVLVPQPAADLRAGAPANLVLSVGAAHEVMTIPNSALVAGPNGSHLVRVPAGNTTRQVPVQIGPVGTVVTEVTSGLQVGQQVVLADLSQPLPTGSATLPRGVGRGGFTGGPAGGGGRAGGAGGGGS